MTIRIKSRDYLGNVAYIVRHPDGRVTCTLANGIPAGLSYAGVYGDEQRVRFMISDLADGDEIVALLNQLKPRGQSYEWVNRPVKQPTKPTRLVINVTGGAYHAVTADGPVDVLFISNEGDDVHNFDEPCLVPVSQDMADPHAYWRWGTEGGSAEVNTEVIDHFFEQLEG